VATHHGLPGAFARSAARRRLFRGFVPLLVLLWVSGGIFGFWLAKWDVPIVAGMCLVAVGLLYGSMRFVEANVDSIRGDWLKYARGLDGERLVSSILDELGSEWHVVHGLQLWQGQDFDHVLVGPGGLFYIQTKNWRGQITRAADELLRNGEYVGAIGAIRAQAMQLKDRLSKETGAPVRWVNAILAVPFAWIDVKGEPKNVAVLQQQDLLKYIQRQPKQFDRAQIDRCVVALERIVRAGPAPRPTTAASARAA
jgi:Nuclease-related domain